MGTEKRLVQWDLLRALAMFLVIVNHASPYLGIMQGIDAGKIVGELALICNPVFFALSGYFAIRKPAHRCAIITRFVCSHLAR